MVAVLEMSGKLHIIPRDSESVREFVGRPKLRLFGFISLLGLPVAFCAAVALAPGFIEDVDGWWWLCWVVVGVKAVFVALTLFFLFTEQPRKIVERHIQG